MTALIMTTLFAITATLLWTVCPRGAVAEAESPHAQEKAEIWSLPVDDKMLTEEEIAAIEEAKAAEAARIEEEKARAELERQQAEQKAKAEQEKAANAVQLSLSETSQGSMDTNAQKIYSVLKAAGLPDVNIAGVLGNWQCESMLDPTSIEGVYGEMYYVGSKKSSAIASPSAYAQSLFSSYAASGIAINQSAYVRANGEVWPGIGLGGFTGPAIDPLISWASSIGRPWYALETQISYAIKGYARASWLANWTTPEASPTDAAASFLHNWEGCYVSYGQRASNAAVWLDKMSGWIPDLEYGKSVLALG